MSLDIQLIGDDTTTDKCFCPHCGHEHVATHEDELYSSNITHNLARMAEALEIYAVVWRPEENGIEYAGELIGPLDRAIRNLREHPEAYDEFNAANGWGTRQQFLPWLLQLRDACAKHSNARVRASR